MADIVPELKEEIEKSFYEKIATNEKLALLKAKLADGTADYKDAHSYAMKMGELLSKALGENVTAEVLPDGTMYFNIADRIVRPLMVEDFDNIADYATEVQRLQNEAIRVNIKGVKPSVNEERIDGVINRVSSEPFEDVKWILEDPIVNYSMSVVDDVIQTNAKFLSKSGIDPVIVRTSEYKCCKWCSSLAGKYQYGTEPKDVYRRHENCRCLTELQTEKDKQNVWTKISYQKSHKAEIEERINALNKMILS